MRKIPAFLVFAFLWCGPSLFAGDVVLNHGFETEDWLYWTETGNVPFHHKGVVKFDTTGNGKPSWTFYQHPGDDCSGGLEQTVYVLEGVTYEVCADVCYHSG